MKIFAWNARCVALNCAIALAVSLTSGEKMEFATMLHRARAEVSTNLTMEEAVASLEDGDRNRVLALMNENGHHHIGANQHLRRHRMRQGKAGVGDAKDMLNGMFEETVAKLDLENVRCSALEAKLSKLMEETHQDIASYNAQAAAARASILRAETQIEILSGKIPQFERSIRLDEQRCHEERTAYNSQLTIVREDLNVIEQILQSIQCAPGSPTALLQCKHVGLGTNFVALGHPHARRQLRKIRNHALRSEVEGVLAALVEEPSDDAMFLQINSVPQLTGQSKCSFDASPNCQNFEAKFLRLQSEQNERKNALEAELAKLDQECEEIKANLEAQIADANARLKDEQAALATATETENEAQEQSRLKNIEHDKYVEEYRASMQTCVTNIKNFENEKCAIAKIRSEVFTVQGQTQPPQIIDCEVTQWEASPCSEVCGGGQQQLTRQIVQHPQGGATCPPLTMERVCNEDPCPVDCRMGEWSGWSTCSANCNGGVQQRSRSVDTQPANGGDPCTSTTETQSCNVQSCDRDCELGEWTDWSPCSKECDGGERIRVRDVVAPKIGQGRCWEEWDVERLHYEFCNVQSCPAPVGETLKCEAKLDVVLVLDGSGSLGSEGWEATKVAGERFVHAMTGDHADIELAVLLFSGNPDIPILYECIDGNIPAEQYQETCEVKWVTPEGSHGAFTRDFEGTAGLVRGLEWPNGFTLTESAVSMVTSMISYSRPDAPTVVVFITDGVPTFGSYLTSQAVEQLKAVARVMWMPVTENVPMELIEQWASQPTHQNIIAVSDFNQLNDPNVISTVIADMCPQISA